MPAPRLAERTRQRLLSLLREDRPEPGRFMRRLLRMRDLDEIPSCAETVRLLANLELGEFEAERLLLDILEHRTELTDGLGRDPGMRVAAVDFLANVEGLLTNPKIVEMSQFEETERSAITDPLTGLFNRRYFRAAIRRETRRCQRYGLHFSVLMLDLDRFKRINDQHGHMVGDLVLRRAARLIRQGVREADVACRFGGEEFAVIFPETDRLGAHAVADRLRRRVEAAFAERLTGGRRIELTISGGISSFPEDGDDPAALVARADETLYQAKRAGRNRVLFYPNERRRSVRYPARPKSRVGLARGDQADSEAEGINFSLDGALVETALACDPTDSVQLLFDGSHGRAPATPPVEGRVVRVEDPPAGAGRWRIGVAFLRPIPERVLLRQVQRGTRRPAVGAPA